MKFKNWKEAYQYILDNTEKSCLNCKYGTDGARDIKDNTCRQFIFCTKALLMADLNMNTVCPNDWEEREHSDNEERYHSIYGGY